MKHLKHLIVLLLVLFSSGPVKQPVLARPLRLPPPPSGGWLPWYEIDFAGGYNDGHWNRISGNTTYLDCGLNWGTIHVDGSISQNADSLHFYSNPGHTAPTIYANDILPPSSLNDFFVRWKIRWTIPFGGWGMGFYFGTVPVDQTYYEHPSYCPAVLGPIFAPNSRITAMQGDGLAPGEINQWFVVGVEYDATTHTAYHYKCDADGNNCIHIGTQVLPADEFPMAMHIGHKLRTHGAGRFQEFDVAYLQVFNRSLIDPEITTDYPWLVWYGPNVGQPTQVIRGTDFTPGGTVQIHLAGPFDNKGDPTVCAHTVIHTTTANASGAFAFTAAYLGTQCRGGWLGWADDASTGLSSNTVDWVTAWFPVHRER